MKKILALSLACAMSVGLLAGCGGNNNSTPSSDESTGGRGRHADRVPRPPPPASWTPIHYSGTYESQIINQVCDRVVEYNDDLSEYVPSLATSWNHL